MGMSGHELVWKRGSACSSEGRRSTSWQWQVDMWMGGCRPVVRR